jgi:roadblock/LC7 domain-containing protein
MAFTTNQLNALEAAIASGQLKVVYDGKQVEYRSVTDLMKARDLVRAELIAAGSITERPLSNRGPASMAVFSRD